MRPSTLEQGSNAIVMMAAMPSALIMSLLSSAHSAEPSRYEPAPPAVATILDAPRPPQVQLSPDKEWFVLLERPALPPIRDIAAPVVKVAGIRLDPDTNGPARENPFTSVSLRRADKPKAPVIPLSIPGRIRSVTFDDTTQRLMLTVMQDNGIELWLADVGPSPAPRRLLGPSLMAAYGEPCAFLPGAEGIICRVVPGSRGSPPVEDPTPLGPRIEENLGRKTPGRTFADLLEDDHDEALLDHYLRSEVVHVSLDGQVTKLLEAGLYSGVDPSPDGQWLLVSEIHRPYSRRVPLGSFPRKVTLLQRGSGKRVELADLPLADDVPITFGSVRTGRRMVGWRADRPATVWWVEALDGGDAGKPAERRDAFETLDAPFTGSPVRLWSSELRFGGVDWGDDHLALVTEWWFADRRTRTFRLDPADPYRPPSLVWDRSYQDEYSNPGDPVLVPGPYGARVLLRTPTGGLLLDGEGVSPKGVHPFLDRLEFAGEGGAPRTTRVWQSRDPLHESVVAVLDKQGKSLLTWRQSQTEVPNIWRRKNGRAEPLTTFADWAAAFAEVRKEVVTYQRADGLPLSATVYYPPGYEPGRDGPRPALLWVYPSEFKHRSDAGQVTAAQNTFDRPGGSSHLFFLLNGWIVVDDPVLPIVAEGDEQPNDTYVEQLVAGAEAVVEALAGKGIIDRQRLVVGGHSYGAFTTANLLAHTDLFRAGIARSGAYNRTLTPFGFQGEERSFWEAPETYVRLSPFTVADKIDQPLLLIHGGDDSNSGTWPVQSERFYQALKGNGAVARWVELPAEDHGYRARESVGHVVWEMQRWAELHAGPAPAAATAEGATKSE
jgi:dipeptidyl aminopeptidase/acylaminoacyl peptidase